MKEFFNILSNVSNFLNEKRLANKSSEGLNSIDHNKKEGSRKTVKSKNKDIDRYTDEEIDQDIEIRGKYIRALLKKLTTNAKIEATKLMAKEKKLIAKLKKTFRSKEGTVRYKRLRAEFLKIIDTKTTPTKARKVNNHRHKDIDHLS